MDDRRLTIIVVPHGDLETRSFEIPYRKLKIALLVGISLLLLFGFLVAMWFPVAAQASRVPALTEELELLESERARVAELAQMLAEVEEQYERVRQMLGADAQPGGGAPILPPLPTDSQRRNDRGGRDEEPDGGAAQTSAVVDAWPLQFAGFITRATSSGRTEHPGLDIAVPKDSYIRAAGAGVVKEASDDEIYGLYVLIDHGHGLESLYGHASRTFVKPGDRVARGEVIALTGSTGQSSAPHLHFEIRKDGRPVDPLTYVRQP
jgi:murein DD-endopeptidase MepM/ murein hydrolase activator NlpD